MRGSGLMLLVVWAAAASAAAFSPCGLPDLECCVSHFSSIVTASGIDLSEQNVARACTVREETEDCMDTVLEQCLQNGTEARDVEDIVNKTKAYFAKICPPTSDFLANLKSHEECILNSSTSFQTCYNKTVIPRSTQNEDERFKKDCCEYKDLRDCALQVVENECGAMASQLVHEEVVHTNGMVLEWSCGDMAQCGNSAVALASSVLLALCGLALAKFLL